MQSQIDPIDLVELEAEPHVTVKYGLHTTDPRVVQEAIRDQPPVRFRLFETSLFENDEHDVLKVDVWSEDLRRLNAVVCGALEFTDTYPEYRPHMTIAYLRRGSGKRYVGLTDASGVDVELSELLFSTPSKERSPIYLRGKRLVLAAPAAVRDAGDELDVDLGDVDEQLDVPSGVDVQDVHDAIQEALDHVTERGMTVANGREYVASVLEKQGIEVPNDSYLDTLVSAHNGISRAAAARRATLEDDDVWGYEYVTAGDERVREEHAELDGVTLPKDDPFWDEYYPPNGWNCRCTVRTIPNEVSEVEEPEDLPELGDGFNSDFQDLYEDEIGLAFCPTGKGGGIDNSCSSRDGTGSSESQTYISKEVAQAKFTEIQSKLTTLYAQAKDIKAKAAAERAANPKGVASSATKKARSKLNAQIKEHEKQLEELKHQLAGKQAPAPAPAPKAGKGEAPTFKSSKEANAWFADNARMNFQNSSGKVSKQRELEFANLFAAHTTSMASGFDLLDRYMQGKVSGDPGGYPGYHPHFEMGDLRLHNHKDFKGTGTGGDYNPSSNTIRVVQSAFIKQDAKLKIGDNNVDFTAGGIFRHEYGHRVWGQALSHQDRKELRQLYEKYKAPDPAKPQNVHGYKSKFNQKYDSIGAKAVSNYAMTNEREFWAESFCAITHPTYDTQEKKLPKDVEEYMGRVLGKRHAVELAFCPTGKGGGIDNSCSSKDGGDVQAQLKDWTKQRDEAVAKIKQIKASGSTKGLSAAKKLRKEANAKIKELEKQIAATNAGKVVAGTPAPKAAPKPSPDDRYINQQSFDDRQAKITSHYDAWTKSLPAGTRGAIKGYTATHYQTQNDQLRKDIVSNEHLSAIRAIDEALDKAPKLEEQLVLYRGVGDPKFENLNPGDVFVERGFLSSSLDEQTAAEFAENAVLVISAPAGTAGAYIDSLSVNPGEYEFLMPRDTHLQVDRIEPPTDAGHAPRIYARVVHQPSHQGAVIGEFVPQPQVSEAGTDFKNPKILNENIGGTTGAKLVEVGGKQYVMKHYGGDEARVNSEYTANKLYSVFGSQGFAPKTSVFTGPDGHETMFAEYIPDAKPLSNVTGEALKAAHEKLKQDFVVDAWLANWDVIGLESDNVLVGSDGSVHRVDNGGALEYRAQGGKKGAKFGEAVNEIDTLRDPSKNASAAKVFGSITSEEITKQVNDLTGNLNKNALKDVVKDQGLADKLMSRARWLQKNYGSGYVTLSFPSFPNWVGVEVLFAFCPTGKGGGIDNSCSSKDGGSSGPSLADLTKQRDEWAAKSKSIVQQIKQLKASGSTSGLSALKKQRLVANKKVKELEQSIAAFNLKKVTEKPAPEQPKASEKEKVTPTGELYKGKLVGRELPTYVSASKWGKEHYEQWRENLPKNKAKAITSYTGEGSYNINAELRKDVITHDTLSRIRKIDAAIDSAPRVPEDIIVHRGIHSGPHTAMFSKLAPGDVFVERGFMSTSLAPSSAFGGDTSMKIRVPKGSSGAYIADLSSHKSEEEFLLPRDTHIRVVSVELKGIYNRTIYAEVVHQPKHRKVLELSYAKI